MDPAWIRIRNPDPLLSFPSFTFLHHIFIWFFFTFLKRYNPLYSSVGPLSATILKQSLPESKNIFSLKIPSIHYLPFYNKDSLLLFHFLARSTTHHFSLIPPSMFLKLDFAPYPLAFDSVSYFPLLYVLNDSSRSLNDFAKRFMKRPWPGLHF